MSYAHWVVLSAADDARPRTLRASCTQKLKTVWYRSPSIQFKLCIEGANLVLANNRERYAPSIKTTDLDSFTRKQLKDTAARRLQHLAGPATAKKKPHRLSHTGFE